MKLSTHFFTTIRNDVSGLLLFMALWTVSANFFPPYILPSPAAVLPEIPAFLNAEFAHHLSLTLTRTLTGLGWALGVGVALGLAAFSARLTPALNSFMVSVQVLPGTIIGIIFLLMFGVGSQTPIALVAVLTLPTIAINTANALAKRNLGLEQYLLSAGGRRRHVIRYVYLPALAPTLQSNLTIGLGLALKVVILGEFIGSQNGLGYLLSVARVYFNMQAVFFYLLVILLITAAVQVAQNAVFTVWLAKYLYAD